jgi:hypothetical protein
MGPLACAALALLRRRLRARRAARDVLGCSVPMRAATGAERAPPRLRASPLHGRLLTPPASPSHPYSQQFKHHG